MGDAEFDALWSDPNTLSFILKSEGKKIFTSFPVRKGGLKVNREGDKTV